MRVAIPSTALRLLAAGTICTVGFAVAFVLAGSGRAVNPILTGSFGPGFTIHVKDANGNDVTSVAPGTYSLEVHDTATVHNFHLTGPAFNMKTSVTGTGTTTWEITVQAGDIWDFRCDPHAPAGMTGSFSGAGSPPTTGPPTTTTQSTTTSTTDTSLSTTTTTTSTTATIGSTAGTTAQTSSTQDPSYPPLSTNATQGSSSTLVVSRVRVQVKRDVLLVRLRVNRGGKARLTLRRRSVVVRSASFHLRAGANQLRLSLPKRHGSGAHMLTLAVTDSLGQARVIKRAVRLR